MDEHALSPAKAVLLAVQLASIADIPTLRTLVAQNQRTLRLELVLRILLSHLPESTEPSDYVPFLEDLISASITEDPEHQVDSSVVNDLDDADAKKRVRKLNLYPLRWSNAPDDIPDDPLTLFLLHRSLLIDSSTGLINQIPQLLKPFLHHSTYLRTWIINTVLPLLRFSYEYYPREGTNISIPKFESLSDRAGVNLLLSRTGKVEETENIGRDMRGLVGPWMYGDSLLKRRKIRRDLSYSIDTIGESPTYDDKYAGWEEVFRWIYNQAESSWKTVVGVVEQWDGPGDADLGDYADGTEWLDEEDQLHLERRYARAILAAAYTITETTEESLQGVYRMLNRVITLLDKDRIPTLQAAAAILIPVPVFTNITLGRSMTKHFRGGLQDEDNIITAPTDDSIRLLQALIVSVFKCTRLGCPISIKVAGQLVCLEDEADQRSYFALITKHLEHGPKEDDKYWIRLRNELLWLRSWGEEELSEGSSPGNGRGVFGRLPKEFIETEILKALLANTRYTLARSIYETSAEKSLAKEALAKTVLAAAMDAFDKSTNPNRAKGGLKKTDDILNAFPETLKGHVEAEKMQHLVKLTDKAGNFRLVFRAGEPFKPMALRQQEDPVGVIEKILGQNIGSYTSIDSLIDLGKGMVKAGLVRGNASPEEKESVAEKRVVAMCIDEALAEDDFETAYSYVVTRLKAIGEPSHTRAPAYERSVSNRSIHAPPKEIDNWSWKAALEAGKYRRNQNTLKPTHLGNASGNAEIRHLEQRMECLSQALKLAPKATLQEILNVFRRCEEELQSHVEREQEQSDAWDKQGDENSAMPGGFADTPNPTKTSRATEEAPMSLFELSRATLGSAISTIKKNAPAGNPQSPDSTPRSTLGDELDPLAHNNGSVGSAPVRKRDQMKNLAVGGLASGVGWLIGAPAQGPNTARDKE